MTSLDQLVRPLDCPTYSVKSYLITLQGEFASYTGLLGDVMFVDGVSLPVPIEAVQVVSAIQGQNIMTVQFQQPGRQVNMTA